MSLSESRLLQRQGNRYCCKQEECDEWLEMEGKEGRLCVCKKQRKKPCIVARACQGSGRALSERAADGVGRGAAGEVSGRRGALRQNPQAGDRWFKYRTVRYAIVRPLTELRRLSPSRLAALHAISDKHDFNLSSLYTKTSFPSLYLSWSHVPGPCFILILTTRYPQATLTAYFAPRLAPFSPSAIPDPAPRLVPFHRHARAHRLTSRENRIPSTRRPCRAFVGGLCSCASILESAV